MTGETSSEKDLKIYGDDHQELMSAFAQRFNVDMTQYLWYFHAQEEGLMSLGSFFFRPPIARVHRIDITMNMLLDTAKMRKRELHDPQHDLPQHRYDILINRIIIVGVVTFGIWKIWSRYFLN